MMVDLVKRAGAAALALLGAAAVLLGPAAGRAHAATETKPAKLPDACTLVTAPDVQAEYAKLGPLLTPTSVQPTTRSRISPHGCSTNVQIPGPAVSTVEVDANPPTKGFPCPPKVSPGAKKLKVSGVKALLEKVPNEDRLRDITFQKKHACIFVEIFLSGGQATIPEVAYVDFAKLIVSRM